MSDYASRRISEAELSVMEALWDAGAAMTAKELQNVLGDARGWGGDAIRSLLDSLTEKGSVVVEGNADAATYAAGFTKAEYGWDLAEVLISRLYGGDAKVLTMAMCQHGYLDRKDLSNIEFRL